MFTLCLTSNSWNVNILNMPQPVRPLQEGGSQWRRLFLLYAAQFVYIREMLFPEGIIPLLSHPFLVLGRFSG